MAKYAVLKSFYASEKWQKFRQAVIAERGPVCQRCEKIIGAPLDAILHHAPVELTPENVNDAGVSLNPENAAGRSVSREPKILKLPGGF